MSLLNDLARSTISVARGIANGAVTVAQAISRAVFIAAKTVGRAIETATQSIAQLSKICAKSYRDAALQSYNFFGGNEAHLIANPSPKNMIETAIHLASLAYIWGFLGSAIANNIRWMGYLPMQMHMLLLGNDTHFFDDASWRHNVWKFTLGLPGMGAGLVLSIPLTIAHIIYQTAKRSVYFSGLAMNLVLDEGDAFKHLEDPAKNTAIQLLSIPAFLLAPIVNVITLPAVLIGRTISNSAKAIGYMVNKAAYFSMHPGDGPIDPVFPLNSNAQKAFALPGYILGGFISANAFMAIVVGRVISNTFKRTGYLAALAMNWVLDPADTIENLVDPAIRSAQKAFSVPAFVFAGAVSLITIPAILFGRTVSNSAKVVVYMAQKTAHLTMHEDKGPTNPEFPLSSNAQKIFALPGYIVGVSISALTFIAVGIDRISTSIFQRTVYFASLAMNWVLDSKDAIKNLTDPAENTVQKVLSSPAFLFAAAISAITLPAILIGRILSNSAKIVEFMAQKTARFAMHENDGPAEPILPLASIAQKIFALPGYIVGAFISAGTFATIGVGRIITNTFRQTVLLSTVAMNWVLDSADAFDNLVDSCASTTQKILSLPAFPIAGLVSAITLPAILIGRFMANSTKTAIFIASKMMNQILPADNAIHLPAPPPRTFAQKLLGGFGFIPGIIVGSIGYACIVLARVTVNTVLTANDLSGSIMNVAFERELFDGLSNKRKDHARFGWGLLGTILALPVVSVGAAIFTFRRSLLLIGIALSPCIAAWRAGNELFKWSTNNLRFSTATTKYTTRLKILFSNLNAWGELTEGASLDGATYRSGWTSFFTFLRKAITFNAQTLTEEILSRIYKKLRAHTSTNTDVDVDAVINEAAKEIETIHLESAYLMPPLEKARTQNEIKRLANYARTVIASDEPSTKPIPTLYHKSRYANLFFGIKDEDEAEPLEGLSPVSKAMY